MKESLLNEQNKGNNKLLDMEEKNDELEIKPENRDNRINTIKTVNSENENEQNLNISFTKKLSLKSQSSILSEFKNFQSSRNSSIASAQPKDRSNTLLSKDCILGPDTASIELKNEIISLNPDLVLPPLLNKRTKFLKEMTYTEILLMEKSEISKPLLKMEDINDIETSKQMFRNLLSYMKLRRSSKEPLLHA